MSNIYLVWIWSELKGINVVLDVLSLDVILSNYLTLK